jgi:hypothetical protein
MQFDVWWAPIVTIREVKSLQEGTDAQRVVSVA